MYVSVYRASKEPYKQVYNWLGMFGYNQLISGSFLSYIKSSLSVRRERGEKEVLGKQYSRLLI